MNKYVLIVLISLVALWPFLRPGFFKSHDGEWMVIRFSAFHQTLASGQLPVRFVDRLNNNYGYPVLNFLYPLPFYVAEFFKVSGFGFVNSIKIVFIFSTLISSVFMFWALRQKFSELASFAGAILYLFSPYRFVDLYVRGSIGENLAFAIIPIIIGCIFKIARGDTRFLPILSISIGLLILSHNVIAILFVPLAFVITLILIKGKLQILTSFIFGFIISMFFWLPAFYDLQYVYLSQIKVSEISDHLVSLSQLILPSWGYGPNPRVPAGLSPQMGLVNIAVFLTAIYLRLIQKKKNYLVDFLLIIYLVNFFLMSKFSKFLWVNFPFVDTIQFPWRLLSIQITISAILAAFVLNFKKFKSFPVYLLISASVISTIAYTKPSAFVNRSEGFYSTNEDSTTARDEYLPLWVKVKPKNRADQKIEIINGDAKIEKSKVRPASYKVSISAFNETNFQVNTIYFPGWKVKANDNKLPIDYQNTQGLITFQLPKGLYEIVISYERTPIHLASEALSLVALIALGIWIFKLWLNKKS